QKNVVKAQSGIALPAIPHVVPEGVHWLLRMERADRVDPTLREKMSVGSAALRLQKRVLVPGFREVDVLVGGNDVVVTSEHYRHARGKKISRTRGEPFEPRE